ncbi:MAG: hypothetical protein HFH38_03490 [Lachnospiraceae bacterium]|nr:hypothetical protein [Lachnospiraceae bacterium]
MGNDKMQGSMEVLNFFQITEGMEGLDHASKELYKNKEVLAIILKGVAREFEGYSYKEIMGFIEADSITTGEDVSPGRTNTRIVGDDKEYAALNEKLSLFDTKFRVINPGLSDGEVIVNLHVDVEAQKTYRPGYLIEKRGIYYLARELSAQLSLVTEHTDYGCLEKCYSIWVCRDNVPEDERFSISFMEMSNTRNFGKCNPVRENYDLLTLVIIRLGDKVFHGIEDKGKNDMMEFLHAVMYPHRGNFLDTVKKHINFSDNEELWKEVGHMSGLGVSIRDECLEEGRTEGRAEGIIESGYDFGLSEQDILARLQKKLQITLEQAEGYMKMFGKQPENFL